MKRPMPPVEQVIAAIATDPESMPLRQKGSKLCQCGRRISDNAFACRECSLIFIDRAITNMENEVTKAAQAGDFAKAGEHARAETRLRQFRMDVVQSTGRKVL